MLNTTPLNQSALLGLAAIGAMVATPLPINANAINTTMLMDVGKQKIGEFQPFGGSINASPINTKAILLVGKHLVANTAVYPDGFLNANAINTIAINTGGTPPKMVFIPPVPLPTTTINALTLNTTRLLIDVPYASKPRQISPHGVMGASLLVGLPKPPTTRFVAGFTAFNRSLIAPVAEPYQLSVGYTARARDDVGNTLDFPLTSLSVNSSLDGVERVTSTTPRQIMIEMVSIIGGLAKTTIGITNSYDVTVYNMVKEQMNLYTPYTPDIAGWLAAATGLTIDIVETVTMSDGSIVERVKNTLATDIALSYDIGVHSSTLTIRGTNRYRHPTWYSLEYAVDYDISSSYGVVTQKPPHVIQYNAGADELIKVSAYNVSGSQVRVQALSAPSMLGINAIVDGLSIQVESMAESHTESSTTVSFNGSIV